MNVWMDYMQTQEYCLRCNANHTENSFKTAYQIAALGLLEIFRFSDVHESNTDLHLDFQIFSKNTPIQRHVSAMPSENPN